MKGILISIIITFLCISPLFSQNNQTEGNLNKLDSLATENTIVHSYIPRFAADNLVSPSLKIPTIHFKVLNAYPFEAIAATQGKVITNNNSYNFAFQPEKNRNQPLLNDFNKAQTNRIFDRFYINSSSSQTTHVAYGEYFQIRGALQWLPNSRFSVDLGGSFSRQYNFVSALRSDILGANARTTYSLTDKIQFNIFGQYIYPSKGNFFNGNSFFPNSSFGSSLLFKYKNSTQVDMGVKYRYYENKMNWNLESVGKISVGF